jgi:hypothetical protein
MSCGASEPDLSQVRNGLRSGLAGRTTPLYRSFKQHIVPYIGTNDDLGEAYPPARIVAWERGDASAMFTREEIADRLNLEGKTAIVEGQQIQTGGKS